MTKLQPVADPAGYPSPPAALGKSLSKEWWLTIKAFPADFWRDCDLPLVVEMLRAFSTADKLAEELKGASDIDELGKLLKLRDLEVKRGASLATKLRIAPQSRSDRHLAGRLGRDAKGTRSWEDNVFNQF